MINKQLCIRSKMIEKLFNRLMTTNSRLDKEIMVNEFRKNYPKLNDDLDFCFEVLAGKHKLGYTFEMYIKNFNDETNDFITDCKTIKEFVLVLKELPPTEAGKLRAASMTPSDAESFIRFLVNREYKLGYSNKSEMKKNITPMLAKKYPEHHNEQCYYIQEKLDGHRTVAIYEEDEWRFYARSGKRQNLSFDMSWADKDIIYDGETMTLNKAGSRDFNHTSGKINGKYTDKSGLHYFIYDIIDDTLNYRERFVKLSESDESLMTDCSLVPLLGGLHLSKDPSMNTDLDDMLDEIVEKGGEGLILRDPNGMYAHGDPRTNALLKYKKLQTIDLRIIGINEGNGKYEGAIGSFVCESEDQEILVNVAGMSDEIRFSDPDDWIGKIIEVAYFSGSKSKNKIKKSLRFPRLKRVRYDKEIASYCDTEGV